jgi:hypothetical protein
MDDSNKEVRGSIMSTRSTRLYVDADVSTGKTKINQYDTLEYTRRRHKNRCARQHHNLLY